MRHKQLLKFLLILILSSAEFLLAQYNLGAMWQGPRLVFNVTPSSAAAVSTALATQPSVALVYPNGNIINNMAKSITLAAYTDAGCSTAASGALGVTTNPLALSSGIAAFAGVNYDTDADIYLKATAPGARSVCWGPITIGAGGGGGGSSLTTIPSTEPVRLFFSGSASIGTNSCVAYDIQTLSGYGINVQATTNVTFNLSGQGSGTFYSNSACTTSITSSTINSGQKSVRIYYKNATAESLSFLAVDQAANLQDGSLLAQTYSKILTIDGPYHIVGLGTCGATTAYQINYLKGDGTQYGSSVAVRIDGYQGGSGGSASAIYSASGCSGGSKISGTGPVTVSGTGPYWFYFKPGVYNDPTIRVYADTETGVLGDSIWVEIDASYNNSTLTLSGGPAAAVNTCAKMTVSTIQTTVTLINDATINITAGGSAQIYSDSDCTNSVSSVVMKGGTNLAYYYLKNAVAETVSTSVSATGFTGANTNATFISATVTPAIASGTQSNCAILTTGEVKCWGQSYGVYPALVSGLSQAATKIDGFLTHYCAVMADQTVNCWGSNNSGQLGDGGTTTRYTAAAVTGITNAVDVSVGGSHSCALLTDTTVRCWGNGGSGQLGNSLNSTSYTPVTVTGLSNVTKLALGTSHSCALLSDSTVKCWGYNFYGQLGDTTNTNSNTFVSVSGISTATDISATSNGSCAALSDGSAKCWGFNSNKEIGDGTTAHSNSPISVVGLSTADKLDGGGLFNCSLLTDDTVMCWGHNFYGQIGTGEATNYPLAPTAVAELTSVVDLATGNSHACALKSDNSIMCWGRNSYGALGTGSRDSLNFPVATGITGAVEVKTGYNSTCARMTDSTVKCWGNNYAGQLGNGETYSGDWDAPGIANPQDVIGITNATEIDLGSAHACALLSDNTIKCWGYGLSGQLGNGASSSSSTPVAVSGISTATQISMGGDFSCARLSDGTVKCWGSNQYGYLGDGNAPTGSNVPVTVSGITTAVSVSAGESHACAVLTDTSTRCWGNNFNGQIGDGAVNGQQNTPFVGASGLTGINYITSGEGYFSCAHMSDNTPRCWGADVFGEMGDETPVKNISLPVSPSGVTNITNIGSGANHSCAVISNDKLKCWGNNANGQLGNGTWETTGSGKPGYAFIDNVSQAAGGEYTTCVVLNDSSISCWGYNGTQQAGVVYTSPVEVIYLYSNP